MHHFRNFEEKSVSFTPGLNLITGPNGRGKTNLLEAIHFASLGYSHRTRRDKELIRWGSLEFIVRVEGNVGDETAHSQSVRVSESGLKKVKVNATESSLLSELMGHYGVVLFAPDDIDIINRGPKIRRLFLDSLLCQLSRDYMENLRKYNRILKQRNALLKDNKGRFGSTKDIIDEQLIAHGCFLVNSRREFAKTFSETCRLSYSRISSDEEVLKVEYKSSLQGEGTDNLKEIFKDLLIGSQDQERRLQTTMIGPHRDNLLLLLGQKPAEGYASQGQKRSIALSIKLSSAHIINANFKAPPILLLDDVFAELDEKRRIKLSDILANQLQVIITSPRFQDIPFKVHNSITI